MLVFAIVFLTTGCMELLYIVNKFNALDVQSTYHLLELQYSTFGRVILAVGFLIASIIPIESKVKNPNNAIHKVTPILGLVGFLVFNTFLKDAFGILIEAVNYKVIIMISEYFIAVALLLTIVFLYANLCTSAEPIYYTTLFWSPDCFVWSSI